MTGYYTGKIKVVGEDSDTLTDVEWLRFDDGTFSLADLGMNRSPTSLSFSADPVAETAAIGSVVGQATAVDPDVDDVLTFSLVDDAGGTINRRGRHVLQLGFVEQVPGLDRGVATKPLHAATDFVVVVLGDGVAGQTQHDAGASCFGHAQVILQPVDRCGTAGTLLRPFRSVGLDQVEAETRRAADVTRRDAEDADGKEG